MKKILLFLILVLSIKSAYTQNSTQVSSRINYQFTVKDAKGNSITGKTVVVELSILLGSETGSQVYSEYFSPSTNLNGLATVEIGGGNVLTGNYNTIDWSKSVYYLRTRVRLPGEKDYSITGYSKFLSVPYSLYSKSSGNGIASIKDNNDGSLTFNFLDGTKYISPILKEITLLSLVETVL